MITLLQKYLEINTAHPHPQYHAAIALFKKQAENDGFLVTELILPSGNPVLIITLQGSCLEMPALALNHHMDVVPADNKDEWLFNPFAGTVHEDYIYGRGTQDCKGLGVVQYAALKMLKQSELQSARTIHYIMVPDEERGGFHGMKEFVEHPLFASFNIGYVLDEGLPSGDDNELLIKIDERTPIQICITSRGQQSHASGLLNKNCIHELTNFLANIAAFQSKQQQEVALNQAGHHISMHITSLSTNNTALNVIPTQAQATLDMRIPSHLSLDYGISLIDELIQKHTSTTYEILATSQERFKIIKEDSMFYQTLAQAVTDHGISPKSFAFEATTDARFYSHKGIQAIGLTPFTVTPNLHGTNESIYINDLVQGTAVLYTFLRAFCTLNN